MTATLNASTSTGVVLTSDTSGNLDIQSNGVSKLSVTASGVGIPAYNPSASLLTSGTAVTSTSGTSIDFTGIPSWTKRITVMFSGVSTAALSTIQIQLGTSSGVETTGYDSYGVAVTNASGVGGLASTTGLVMGNGLSAVTVVNGSATICLLGSNKWVFSVALSATADNRAVFGAGGKTLSGTLDRVRITTVVGTDTFDAGSINILYE